MYLWGEAAGRAFEHIADLTFDQTNLRHKEGTP